jgi:carbon catabolite-derepressing protein kinase
MASRPFDDEELSISLSSTQVQKTNRNPRSPMINVRPVGDMGSASMASGAAQDKVQSADSRLDQYKIVRTLGEGSFGKVKLAVHKSTGQQVALKIISRKKLISRDMTGRVEREIEFLQLLRHPHIIKL